MTEGRQVVGLFRDRGQARLAVAAARRLGLGVQAADELLEDAEGVHVALLATAQPEHVRQLLLEYGAYRATVLEPGAG